MQAPKSPHPINTAPSKTSLISDSLASYDIIAPLGRGAHSFVYKARHKTTKKLVAIKVIDTTNAKSIKQVQNEIRAHSAFCHPNIIRLIDHFKDDSNHYLILEHCERGELFSHLQAQGGKINETEMQALLAQIFNGLVYIHAKCIIHRDIKLGNILLDNRCEVKISDFGLAIPMTEASVLLSQPLCGTPNYLAPELIFKKRTSFASDIWAVGCVAFALFEGSLPFEEQKLDDTLARIVKATLVRPKNMSDNLWELISALMAADPKQRPSALAALNFSFFGEANKQKDESTMSTLEPSSLIQRPHSFINFHKTKKTSGFLEQLKSEKPSSKFQQPKINNAGLLECELSFTRTKPQNRNPSETKRTEFGSFKKEELFPTGPNDFGFVKSRINMGAIINSISRPSFFFRQKQTDNLLIRLA